MSLKCEKEKKIWGKGLEGGLVRDNMGVRVRVACVYMSVGECVCVVFMVCVMAVCSSAYRRCPSRPACVCVPSSLGGYGVLKRALQTLDGSHVSSEVNWPPL